MFDVTDVGFVRRITVGSSDPQSPKGEAEIQAAMDFLNRCLTEVPRGRILGMEKSFSVVNIGEHQVVLQWITYHVGFTRKPAWIESMSG